MKKLLLSLAAMALCSTAAMAESVTFDFTTNDYGLPNDGDTYVTTPATISQGAVSIQLNGDADAWRMWTDGLRVYYKKAPTFTVTADGETITGISFTAKSGVAFSDTKDGSSITSWSGSSTGVTLYSVGSGNAALYTITVTYGEGGDDNPGGGGDNPSEPTTPSVTFDFVNSTYGAGPAYTDSNTAYVTTDNVASADGVYVTFEPNSEGSAGWRFWNDGIRAYYKQSPYFTVSVPGGKVLAVTWTAKSGATFAVQGESENITSWAGETESVRFNYTNTSSNLALITLTVEYELGEGALKPAGLSFEKSTITVSLDEDFVGQTVNNPNNLEVTYTSSNPEIATVDNNGNVTLVAAGTTVITASSEETEEFLAGKATYTLTVQNASPEEVLTVAEAIAMINDGFRGTAQVKGYISEITEISTQYGNATYKIVDDLDANEVALTVYRGYWLDGQKFTAGNEIAVGGLIVVEGELMDYNGTLEVGTGGKVISYQAPSGTDTPDPDQPEEPGDTEEVTEDFTTGIGLPEGSGNIPTVETSYTSTETGITYNIYACYTNSGYLMMNAKTYDQPYISWSLEYPMKALKMKTTNNCSENEKSQVEVYGNDVLIGTYAVNVRNAEVVVEIPTALQAVGTVYKVMSTAGAKGYNQQFASFTYVEDVETAVETIEVANDGEAVYYNLQGVKVNNPERGIYIMVKDGNSIKVVK